MRKRLNIITWSACVPAFLFFAVCLSSESVLAATRVFYDGFESGNTNLWGQDGTRNKCTVATASLDGVQGAFSGTRMARCNWNGTVVWNDPAVFETLVVSPNYTSELFYRIRFRPDSDLVGEVRVAPDPNPGSPTRPKILRIYPNQSPINDLFLGAYDSIEHAGTAGDTQLATWWGSGQNDGGYENWHEVEYYFNHQTGAIKIWNDGNQTRDDSGFDFGGTPWTPLYITSNWSGPDGCCNHDTTNHMYFDEVEIFSDSASGSPASGLMSDGTIQLAGADMTPPVAPSGLGVQ